VTKLVLTVVVAIELAWIAALAYGIVQLIGLL
jgi:hypothetical protein